jgi:hypothetical protein
MNKVLLGIHVGTQEKIPQTEQEKIALIRSSLLWQEYNGPMIIALDEAFYIWLHHNGLEGLYQDIIPLSIEYEDEEDIRKHFEAHVPYELYFVGMDELSMPNEQGKTFSIREEMEQKDFVDLQLELLPNEYKKLWQADQ